MSKTQNKKTKKIEVEHVVVPQSYVEIVCITGAHSVGKSTVFIPGLKKTGDYYCVEETSILRTDIVSPFPPQSLQGEMAWCIKWRDSVLSKLKETCDFDSESNKYQWKKGNKKKAIIVDRSPFSAPIYLRSNDPRNQKAYSVLLGTFVSDMISSFSALGVRISTVYISDDESEIWGRCLSRYEGKCKKNPDTTKLKEDSLDQLIRIVRIYEEFKHGGMWTANIDGNTLRLTGQDNIKTWPKFIDIAIKRMLKKFHQTKKQEKKKKNVVQINKK